MVLLRYLYVVALVLWVGGLITAGALVAPSVFGVLQAWNETQGRVLAGQVFGEVLLRLTWLSYAMGGIMFITLTLHRLLGARPVKYAIQTEVQGPVSALAETDPRRMEFDRLHGLSNILFSLTAIGGLALCFWETRE
jgi:hypothetical protein